jgi:hypothetical protein
MSPPPDANGSACPEFRPISAQPAALPAPSTATGTPLVPMEAFIWQDANLPAGNTEAAAGPAQVDNAPELDAPHGDGAASPRIVMSPVEAPEPDDGWRRQFISALKDVDRESANPPPLTGTPPPLPYINVPRRPPPRSLAPNHPAGIPERAPLARVPRHRDGLSLLGLSAAAGLLSVVLPYATDMPETANTAAGSPLVLTSTHKAPAPDSDVFKPVIFNAPVLVREGIAPISPAAPPVLPVIETVRTVPVKLGREPIERGAAAPLAAVIERPAAPAPAPQPTPAAAPLPLDRDGLTTLVAEPPTQQPAAATAPPPPPIAHRQKPAAQPPRAETSAPRRAPRISTSYKRTASKATKQAGKRSARPASKSANRTRQAQWETRRHGLRTTPPPEPSTLQKIVKWIWPWSQPESTGKSPR